jgi:hypothetical protein
MFAEELFSIVLATTFS